MHKYAEWTIADLMALAADTARANRLPAKDVIAITALLKAATDVPWGDKSREFVTQRMDGDAPKVEVDIAVGVAVKLTWADGSEA